MRTSAPPAHTAMRRTDDLLDVAGLRGAGGGVPEDGVGAGRAAGERAVEVLPVRPIGDLMGAGRLATAVLSGTTGPRGERRRRVRQIAGLDHPGSRVAEERVG